MENYHEEGLVFFTDLTNFNRTIKNLELKQIAKILTTFADLTHRTVTSGEGTIIGYMYDRTLGYFPADSVDKGVRTLLKMKNVIEGWLSADGYKMKLRIGAHYGRFMVIYLLPFTTPDLLGETVNAAVRLGSGG